MTDDLSNFDGGEPVFRDSRADAIANGRLVDLSADFDTFAQSLGIIAGVAMTSAAFDAVIWPTDDRHDSPRSPDAMLTAGERLEWRACRVLRAYAFTVRRLRDRIKGPAVPYVVSVLFAPGDWREIALRAVAAFSDAGEPVLTIGLANEQW